MLTNINQAPTIEIDVTVGVRKQLTLTIHYFNMYNTFTFH